MKSVVKSKKVKAKENPEMAGTGPSVLWYFSGQEVAKAERLIPVVEANSGKKFTSREPLSKEWNGKYLVLLMNDHPNLRRCEVENQIQQLPGSPDGQECCKQYTRLNTQDQHYLVVVPFQGSEDKGDTTQN
ncbi:hypothetical protein MG293_008121 [Ovis ammon polii]|uniref:Uncharacterized protein n=1 Tax=Ovis ammon polii TaxID=230172 RepID=A0AAD4UAZ7_OVIAM|nr:hypothetical protein MG293_008121 [Ovis ammon polii]